MQAGISLAGISCVKEILLFRIRDSDSSAEQSFETADVSGEHMASIFREKILVATLFRAYFSFGQFLNGEDGGGMFLQNARYV